MYYLLVMGRIRRIIKSGNSTYIHLKPSDLCDLELSVGDFVDINEITKIKGVHHARNNS